MDKKDTAEKGHSIFFEVLENLVEKKSTEKNILSRPLSLSHKYQNVN